MAIQSDGKIVVAGDTTDGSALARYADKGELDPTFDGDGKVTGSAGEANDLSGGFDTATTSSSTPGAASWSSAARPAPPSPDMAVVRDLPGGKLDSTFGAGVTADFHGFGERGHDVGTDAAGRIVAAGSTLGPSGDEFALMRVNP